MSDITFEPVHRTNEPANWLILDIDGVFNPHMGVNLPDRGFVVYNKMWISWALNVSLHTPMLEMLEEHARVVWGSTWGDESNALAGWLFMKETSYPHIPLSFQENQVPGSTWKLSSINQWAEVNVRPEDRVVWVEDEVEADAFRWAEERGNVLILRTDPAVGLTSEDAQKAYDFFVRD